MSDALFDITDFTVTSDVFFRLPSLGKIAKFA